MTSIFLPQEHVNSFWLSWRAKDLYKTRDLLVRSLKIDANNASAHALLADTYIMSNQVPLDGDYLNPRAIARARQFADKAVECDPRSPLARSVKARALTFQRNHSAAVKEIDCALALDPNYTDWRFPMLLVIAGDHERAIDAAQKHMCADQPIQTSPSGGWERHTTCSTITPRPCLTCARPLRGRQAPPRCTCTWRRIIRSCNDTTRQERK